MFSGGCAGCWLETHEEGTTQAHAPTQSGIDFVKGRLYVVGQVRVVVDTR